MLRIGSSKTTLLQEKESRYEFNNNQQYFNDFLRLKSWNIACFLGLVGMNGTWDLGLETWYPM